MWRTKDPRNHSWCRLMIASALLAAPATAYRSTAQANMQSGPPANSVFRIAFLAASSQKPGSQAAKRLQWVEPNTVLGSAGNAALGPFLRAADLRSIRLTINANALAVPSAGSSIDQLKPLYTLLRETRLIEILAVAPAAGRTNWSYITGPSQQPHILGPNNLPPSSGEPNPWAVVTHILSTRGFNAFALPDSQGRVKIVTPLRDLPLGTQGAVYAPPLATDPKQQKVDALIELSESPQQGIAKSSIVAASQPSWQPKPWTPAFVMTPDQ